MNSKILAVILATSFLFQACKNSVNSDEGVKKSLLEYIEFVEYQEKYSRAKVVSMHSYNQYLMDSIVGSIKQKIDPKIQEKAMAIHSETELATSYIHELRKKIINATGGYIKGDPMKGFARPAEWETTDKIMVGDENSQGAGSVLEKTVNLFIKKVNTIQHKQKFQQIALSGFDNPLVTTVDLKMKSFVEFHFKEKPMIMTIHTLNLLLESVEETETRALLAILH